MDAALPLDNRKPAEGRPATFGTASLVFALLTVVLPVVVMIFFGFKAADEDRTRDSHGWAPLLAVLVGLAFSFIVCGLSSLVGTLTGAVALVRGERAAWRPVVGLIVNAPVLALVAYAVIVTRMNNGG